MAKTILEEAMEDAKLLKETAIENAKNVLVEAISPKIKEFVDEQLGESMYEENPAPGAALGEADDGDDDEDDMDIGGDDDDAGDDAGGDEQEELELLASLLKKLGVETNMDDAGGDMDLGGLPHEGVEMAEAQEVAEGQEMDEVKEENVEEVVEFTNEDLKTALSEVLGDMKLKSEATVTKGFGAVQDATPKSAGGKGEKGLADEKSGEHQWADETPPAAQDFTVKEAAYRQKIAVFEKAVSLLKNENAEYKKACAFLKRNLQEVNLFNSKLIYTNKLLHSAKLNNEQRLNVIETFDKAQSLREVELVYKSLSESFKIAGVLAESKQSQRPSLKGPKGSRFSAPGSSLLSEAASKEDGGNSAALRMQELAGLID